MADQGVLTNVVYLSKNGCFNGVILVENPLICATCVINSYH
jgi:hypothetical protein